MIAAALVAALLVVQQTDTQFAVRPGTRLDLTNQDGSIVVRAWTQNSVRVHADHGERDRIHISSDPSVLRVEAVSRRGAPDEVSYTIDAPSWMALNLSGVHADVDVDGSAAPVRVESVSGDIHCRGGAGQISLRSVSGSIALQMANGRTEIHGVSDDITLSDVRGDVTVESVSGDITLEAVRSSNVDVNTVSGDVRYSGTIENGGRYKFASHSGDVAVAVPEGTNASVSVETFNGDFDSSFPVSVTGSTKRHFGFTLGTGSATLDLATFSGDVKLRRPGQLKIETHGHDHDHDTDHDQDDHH